MPDKNKISIIKPEAFKNKLTKLYENSHGQIMANSSDKIIKLRKKAFKHFEKTGFPSQKEENWRFTNLNHIFRDDYVFNFETQFKNIDTSEIFRCDVYDLDTYCVTLINGWFAYNNTPLTTLEDGTIIGSLYKAMKKYPKIVEKHLGSIAKPEESNFVSLNTAFMQDGLFIYVPDDIKVEKPVQIINIIDSEKPTFLQPRNLIIVGKNSNIKVVHCDHAIHDGVSFTNTVSEILVDKSGSIDHYKVQNKGKNSALLTTLFFKQEKDSNISNTAITLNGGFTRNQVDVSINGENCNSNLKGLFIIDGQQHVDNQVFVDHITPKSKSNQIYKGIIDDQASGVFSGRVLVRKDSQQTIANQNNKNILLTDNATINTQPFLEIYADDVKCSHGATVGQLDPNAMFYLRSRGLCERTARQLLMFAFADEVVKNISIKPLKINIAKLVEKRLKGELSICDQCFLHCNNPEPGFMQNTLC